MSYTRWLARRGSPSMEEVSLVASRTAGNGTSRGKKNIDEKKCGKHGETCEREMGWRRKLKKKKEKRAAEAIEWTDDDDG